ncbi:hypothetical protein EIKCOROL_02623 [Eikenella corrodens ATCC 23834]|uniref:Uncharacterized protein n=1 Tax=Eikenella corrodens ATCC 23834 TaxID=546274 RepID=C0DZ06_EIKCO|nr:hypothetical protein EIKCOROL_02623 [Eikenella corrodens ATCC 23834]
MWSCRCLVLSTPANFQVACFLSRLPKTHPAACRCRRDLLSSVAH